MIKFFVAHRHFFYFIAVGCTAAAVHWGVVFCLVEHLGWPPLLANVLGWLVAFGASFTGHHALTFRNHGTPMASAARRFFTISACGFTVNEAVYAVALRWSTQRYDLLLAMVLIGVAGFTYVLSRYWAFDDGAATSSR